MKTRTTQKTLETLCQWINEAMGNPLEPYTRDETGRYKANIGNYHMSGAYGGVCVHRMVNDSGGISTPIWGGHIPKREAEALMRAYLRGIATAKANA